MPVLFVLALALAAGAICNHFCEEEKEAPQKKGGNGMLPLTLPADFSIQPYGSYLPSFYSSPVVEYPTNKRTLQTLEETNRVDNLTSMVNTALATHHSPVKGFKASCGKNIFGRTSFECKIWE